MFNLVTELASRVLLSQYIPRIARKLGQFKVLAMVSGEKSYIEHPWSSSPKPLSCVGAKRSLSCKPASPIFHLYL